MKFNWTINVTNDNFFDEVANLIYNMEKSKFTTTKGVLSWCLKNSEDGKINLDRDKICEDLEISKSNLSNSLTALRDLYLIDNKLNLRKDLQNITNNNNTITIECII